MSHAPDSGLLRRSLGSCPAWLTDVVGGNTATGTITLIAAAPSRGFVVSLSSDNPVAATVPPSATVAAGATSATFTVTTNTVTNAQSAIILGTVSETTRHAVITVWDPFHHSNGSIAILPGGNGSGRVTSQPAGIDGTITRGNGAGTCDAFFAVGTVVRLDARPATDSSFGGARDHDRLPAGVLPQVPRQAANAKAPECRTNRLRVA